MSGRRESNPRPSAWEADALPTELLPLETISNPFQKARKTAYKAMKKLIILLCLTQNIPFN